MNKWLTAIKSRYQHRAQYRIHRSPQIYGWVGSEVDYPSGPSAEYSSSAQALRYQSQYDPITRNPHQDHHELPTHEGLSLNPGRHRSP